MISVKRICLSLAPRGLVGKFVNNTGLCGSNTKKSGVCFEFSLDKM